MNHLAQVRSPSPDRCSSLALTFLDASFSRNPHSDFLKSFLSTVPHSRLPQKVAFPSPAIKAGPPSSSVRQVFLRSQEAEIAGTGDPHKILDAFKDARFFRRKHLQFREDTRPAYNGAFPSFAPFSPPPFAVELRCPRVGSRQSPQVPGPSRRPLSVPARRSGKTRPCSTTRTTRATTGRSPRRAARTSTRSVATHPASRPRPRSRVARRACGIRTTRTGTLRAGATATAIVRAFSSTRATKRRVEERVRRGRRRPSRPQGMTTTSRWSRTGVDRSRKRRRGRTRRSSVGEKRRT